jgi:hypothetical protein
MSDPNLRRLLDASRSRDGGTPHFVLRKQYTLTPAEREKAARTIGERAQAQAARLGITGAEKTQHALDHAIDRMLRQATDETTLLRDMGVVSIWLNDFDEIPPFVSQIPGSPSEVPTLTA